MARCPVPFSASLSLWLLLSKTPPQGTESLGANFALLPLPIPGNIYAERVPSNSHYHKRSGQTKCSCDNKYKEVAVQYRIDDPATVKSYCCSQLMGGQYPSLKIPACSLPKISVVNLIVWGTVATQPKP